MDSSGSGWGPVACYCEHGHKLFFFWPAERILAFVLGLLNEIGSLFILPTVQWKKIKIYNNGRCAPGGVLRILLRVACDLMSYSFPKSYASLSRWPTMKLWFTPPWHSSEVELPLACCVSPYSFSTPPPPPPRQLPAIQHITHLNQSLTLHFPFGNQVLCRQHSAVPVLYSCLNFIRAIYVTQVSRIGK
jgi:hypothetical protein